MGLKKSNKALDTEKKVFGMAMDDVMETWRKRPFTDEEKKSVLKRLLSYTDYFYNRGDSPYAEMGIKLAVELSKDFPGNPEIEIMAGNAYSWLIKDRVNASKHYVKALKMEPDNCDYYKKAIGCLCLAEKFMEADVYVKQYEARAMKCMDKGDLKVVRETIEKLKVKFDGNLSIMADYDWPDDEEEKPAGREKWVRNKSGPRSGMYNTILFTLGLIYFIQSCILKYPENEPFNWFFSHPVYLLAGAAAFLYLMIKYPMWVPNTPLVAKIILTPLMAGVYLMLFIPVGGLVNAYMGTVIQDKTLYVTVSKHEDTGKDHAYILKLKDPARKETFEWKVGADNYKNTNPGDVYNPGFYRGSMGIIFRYLYK